jgi:hypothetical protein
MEGQSRQEGKNHFESAVTADGIVRILVEPPWQASEYVAPQ